MAVVTINSDSRYQINRKRVRAVVVGVLKESHADESNIAVSVAVVGNRKMRQLNREYHETDATTDVLSFPYLDPQSQDNSYEFIEPEQELTMLGDIVISYPETVRQAAQKNKLVDDEIDFLIEHGMQHLLGNHHD